MALTRKLLTLLFLVISTRGCCETSILKLKCTKATEVVTVPTLRNVDFAPLCFRAMLIFT